MDFLVVEGPQINFQLLLMSCLCRIRTVLLDLGHVQHRQQHQHQEATVASDTIIHSHRNSTTRTENADIKDFFALLQILVSIPLYCCCCRCCCYYSFAGCLVRWSFICGTMFILHEYFMPQIHATISFVLQCIREDFGIYALKKTLAKYIFNLIIVYPFNQK